MMDRMRTKRVRVWALALCGALSALVACGGESTAPETLPRIGRYSYAMAVPVNIASPNLRTFTGSLVVTFISPDSLAGYWEVPSSTYQSGAAGAGYQARLALGFFNGGGWYFFAYPTDGGTIQHRLFAGTPPRCEGAALYANNSGGVTRREGTCTVTFVGP